MKAIMISIQPQHCGNILNLIKKLEMRKSCPKEWKDYLSDKTKVKPKPVKVYIYCTKQGRPLVYGDVQSASGYVEKYTQTYNWSKKDADRIWGNLQGKVVAEFTLNEVDLLVDAGAGIHYTDKDYNLLDTNDLLKQSCLTEEQIYNYLGENKDNKPYYNDGYAWHIDDLKIYDVPRELGEFVRFLNCKYCADYNCFDSGAICPDCIEANKLTRPPQSWGYCEELEEENV